MGNKTLLCDPGQCGAYSSVGYILLGYLLYQELVMPLGEDLSWQDYNQTSVIPASVADQFSTTLFMMEGHCSLYTDRGVVTQYAIDRNFDGVFVPTSSWSCLNGWTCGNLAISPTEAARFFWMLLHGNSSQLLSNTTLRDEMLKFKQFL